MGHEREIPIKQLVISSNRARCGLDEPTVERYMEQYREEERKDSADRLPPIEAEVVQTGDLSTLYYIVVDGAYRLEAQVRLDRKRVMVSVTHEMGLTPDSVDSMETRKTLLKRHIESNRRHGLPFNKEDIRHQVRSLVDLGESKVRISEIVGVSRITLDKWFPSDFLERRQRDEHDKIEYVRLKREGLSAEKAAKAVGRSPSVGRFWDSKLREGKSPLSDHRRISLHRQNVKPLQIGDRAPATIDAGGPSQPEALPPTLVAASSHHAPATAYDDCEQASREKISAIFNAITELPWSPAVEAEVQRSLFPLLCRKSPWVKALTEEGGLSRMYATLRKDYERLRAELNEATRTISLKDKDVAALRDEVKKRQAHCSYGCGYSLQRVAAEATKFVRAGLSNFQDVAGILESNTAQQRAVTIDTALRAAAKFLSLLEWSLQEGFVDQAQHHAFAEFREQFLSLEELHTISEGVGKRVRPRDVLLRIRKCDAHLTALQAKEDPTTEHGKASLVGEKPEAVVATGITSGRRYGGA